MATLDAVVLLAEGFEDIEAVSVIDVLRRGGVDVVTASIGDSVEVKSAHGIAVIADKKLSELDGRIFKAIVLPGGMPGTTNLASSPEVLDMLKRHAEAESLVCAICAAPTVLAKAEILDEDIHVTCYPGCESGLGRSSANVPVVKDGNFITGQAPGSALLFSLVVLQSLAGDQVSAKVAEGMVVNVFNG